MQSGPAKFTLSFTFWMVIKAKVVADSTGSREPAMGNNGRRELEIVEIAHHYLSVIPSAMGRQRRPRQSSAGEDASRQPASLLDGIRPSLAPPPPSCGPVRAPH